MHLLKGNVLKLPKRKGLHTADNNNSDNSQKAGQFVETFLYIMLYA